MTAQKPRRTKLYSCSSTSEEHEEETRNEEPKSLNPSSRESTGANEKEASHRKTDSAQFCINFIIPHTHFHPPFIQRDKLYSLQGQAAIKSVYIAPISSVHVDFVIKKYKMETH